MIKHFPLLLSTILLPTAASAVDYSVRGYLSAKAGHYTNNKTNENSGQNHRAQFEQESRISPELIFVNQVRWSYSSLYTDLSTTPPTDQKDTHKIYLGDNYVKYKASSWVLQTGYQEVAWGEAFGFNYADIVNPKDMKATFYSDYSDSRLPLFLVNYKYFFTDGSLQLIYSPESKFSDTLPVNLFAKNVLPQTAITTLKEHSPDFFKEKEYGGKLSKSFLGIDASAFYFNYLDRDASYDLRNASLTSVTLAENHSRVNTTGISLASTLFDNYVFRADVVYTKNKRINSIDGFTLISTPVNLMNYLVSIDTPTYNKFSAVFIFASSQLSEELPQAFREKSESFSIAKLSYDFGEEKIFDLSYTHQFTNTGHGVQSLLTWPVTNSLDLRVGAEIYWGDETSQLYKIKNVSNVFFGIKNYFQL
ncbi:MAG: hypothetical protein H7336_14195 [Bacteriovorax sp.]|nr:hypothetical protein [Bacteriovorax sp.]